MKNPLLKIFIVIKVVFIFTIFTQQLLAVSPVFVRNYQLEGTTKQRVNGKIVPLPRARVAVRVRQRLVEIGNYHPVYDYTVILRSDGNGRFKLTIACYKDADGNTSSSILTKLSHTNRDQGGLSTSGGTDNCTFNGNRFRNQGIILSPSTVDDQNLGESCSVGKPINMTNGNMWIKQTDFRLAGIGKEIAINRTYNSNSSTIGMFGRGWSSELDEYLSHLGDQIIIHSKTGRGFYFRKLDGNLYQSASAGAYGQVVKNADNSYTYTNKEGIISNFSSTKKITSKIDRNGNTTSFNYNSNDILTSITDPSGRSLNVKITNGLVENIKYDSQSIASYSYDTGKLKEITYQDGSKYKFDYISSNGNDLIKTVKDALDNVIEEHAYDSDGRATTSEIDGGNEKYTINYDHINDAIPYASVTHKKESNGADYETKYYFDSSKDRNVITKIEGNCNCGGGAESTEFEYDDKLNLTKKTDAIGRETNYTYDDEGNPLTITDTWGIVTNTFNSIGQILTSTDRMGGIWTITYDANGNVTSLDDPLPNISPNPNELGITKINYPTTNNRGLPTSIKDARGNTTGFLWFSNGLLQQVTDADSKVTKFTYDSRSRIKTTENALTHLTQYNYFDDSTRKVEVIYPNSDKMTYEYDIRRLLEKVTDARGKITNYEFDDAYRLKKITDPLGHFREYDYDLMSNMTSYTDPLGNVTNYSYDEFDRLEEVKYPLVTTEAARLKVNYIYDDVGRIKTFSDTDQRITTYNYDDVNRINEVINAELESNKTEYNQRFQTIKVTDANNQVYDFTYDSLGRMKSQTRAGTTQSYEYDEVGNRIKRIDHLGKITEYKYDDLNRLKNIEYYTNNNLSYQSIYDYDDISRLISATNEAGTVTFAYDNLGRTTSTTDVHNQTVGYEYVYNSTVNKTELKLNGTLHAVYNFDDANRLTTMVNSSDSTITSFAYDDADRLTTKSLPNNVQTSYSYDGMSRLTRLKDSNSTATLFDRQYSYNSANQISQIVEPSLTRDFTYDDVNRLETVTASNSANENYVYDNLGNRTSSLSSNTYGYGLNNRLTSTQNENFGYNANGTMTTKAEGSNFWRYNWDHENRLTNASKRRERVNYEYDALGRRTKTSGFIRGVTKYTYDGLDVIQDDDSATGITKYQNGLGIDNKLSLTKGTNKSYFLSDHLGSTNGLADSSGNLTSSASYDSFGNKTGNLATRYQFTGREKDDVTDLYYYRARQYDSKLGRFISEDPIGFAGGDVNLYGYVGNNPLHFVDPMGLKGWGSQTADWGDEKIEYARRFYQGGTQNWVWNGTVNTIADISRIGADVFRLGDGTGNALFNDCASTSDKVWGVGADIGRGLTIAGGVGGGLAKIGNGIKGIGKYGKNLFGGFGKSRGLGTNPFKGKTPQEIDDLFRAKGYQSSGDPVSGYGGYVNPRNGRSYHIDPKDWGKYREPNHVDVNRLRSYKGLLEKRKYNY